MTFDALKTDTLSLQRRVFGRLSAVFHVVPALCLLPSTFCLLFLANGCIHRSLTIQTDPPGAMVYVNDQLKGQSPVTYDFLWYGWHRVLLRKDGYERVEDRKELRAPLYFWIPLDLAMELLPFPIRDARTWSYGLTPSAAPPNPLPPALLQPANTEPPHRPSSETHVETPPASDVPASAGTPSETPPSEPSQSAPPQETSNAPR